MVTARLKETVADYESGCTRKRQEELPFAGRKVTDCWHGTCQVRRVLSNGRYVLENNYKFVRLADPDDVIGV